MASEHPGYWGGDVRGRCPLTTPARGTLSPWTLCQRAIRPSGLPSVGSGAGARAARKGRAAWQAGAVTRAAALQGVRCAAATLHTGPQTRVAANAARFARAMHPYASRSRRRNKRQRSAARRSPAQRSSTLPRAAPRCMPHPNNRERPLRVRSLPINSTPRSIPSLRYCIRSGRHVRGRLPRPANPAPARLRTQT